MKHSCLWLPTLLAAPALAVDTVWLGGSGAWTSAAKWSAGVPTAQDTAVFDLLGTASVTMPGAEVVAPARRLIVKRGVVNLSGGGRIELDWNNAFSAAFVVGETPGTLARCVSPNQTIPLVIQGSSADLGTVQQAQGELILRGQASLEMIGVVRAGVAGSGWIQHDAGTTLKAGSLELGTLASGAGSLSGLGSSSGTQPPSGAIDIAGNLTIGKFGTGTAWIGSGSCGSLMVGQGPSGSGTTWITNLQVNGPAWIGYQGTGAANVTGALGIRGPLAVALRAADVGQPTLPPSRGTLNVVGGSVRATGSITLGYEGIGSTTISSGGSIESTLSISRGSDDTLVIRLPAEPTPGAALAAPAMTLNPGGNGVAIEVLGSPAPTAVWHIARSWDAAPPACSVSGSPGAGREFRLVACGGDLYLTTAPVGEPNPDLCPDATPSTFVADSIGVAERGFGNGGVALGDGFVAIGCPGTGGGLDVYRAVNGAWYYETTLVAPDGRQLGLAVAASGTRLASRTVDATSVVVFARSGGSWTVEQVIDPPTTVGTQSRRNTLALDGDTLAIGEPNATVNNIALAGRVDIHRRTGSAWVVEAALVQSPLVLNGRVGRSVALSGDRLVVGTGSALMAVFDRSGSTWTDGPAVASTASALAALSGSTVALASGNLFGWERNDSGAWVEALNGPLASRIAASPDRIDFSGGSASLRTMERIGASWRMGESITLQHTIEGLADAGGLVVALHTNGFSVVGDLPPAGCPADLSGDGMIGGADLGLLLGAWDTTALGDVNADGVTDGADLGLLLSAWGPCEP